MSDEQVTIRGVGGRDRLMPASEVIHGLIDLLKAGRIDEAAKIYGRCSVDIGYQLTNRISADRKVQKAAANMLYRARDYGKAAMVCEALEEYDKAASLYEKGDDVYMAAEMYARSGNNLRAAAMYERGGNLDQAARLYVEVGEKERAAECYRRIDRPFAAGRLYNEIGKDRAAVELLQRVPDDHVDYLTALELLADLLAKNGYAKLGVKKLVSAVGDAVTDNTISAWYKLGDLYARLGKTEEARKVFGDVLSHDFQYRDAASRLKRLEEGEPEEEAIEVEVDMDMDETADVGDTVVSVDESLDFLKDLPLFEDLSLDDLRAMANIAQPRSYTPGQPLIEQGAHGEALYVITAGSVEVKRTDASTEQLLAVLPKGAHVGEMSLIDDAPTIARVVAAEPTEALMIPVEDFRALLDTRPALALKIYQVLSITLVRRLRATSAKLRPDP